MYNDWMSGLQLAIETRTRANTWKPASLASLRDSHNIHHDHVTVDGDAYYNKLPRRSSQTISNPMSVPDYGTTRTLLCDRG